MNGIWVRTLAGPMHLCLRTGLLCRMFYTKLEKPCSFNKFPDGHYTGLFISLSGISDLCGTVTGMVTPKGSMSTEGEILQFSVLRYRSSICPPLVTRQMSNLAILADSKTQNASLFPVHAMFRHDCPLAVKLASTQWNLANQKKKKKNLERICTY